MDATFRPLTYERELLEKLLEPEFPSRDEPRRQLDFVAAKQILEDGTLALECGPCQRAPVNRPSKESKILNLPAARDLALFTPYGEADVKWSMEERKS
ncbi:MAG: hypothetical protein ABSH32_32520 [Bryobacteraceae bacterium]|jgi:hypothetical protein